MSSEQNHLRLDPPAIRSMLSVFDGLATDLARETEHLAQAGAAAAAGDPRGYLRTGLDHLYTAVAQARTVEAQLRELVRNSELTIQAFEQHDALVAAAHTVIPAHVGDMVVQAMLANAHTTSNPGKISKSYRSDELEYVRFNGNLYVQGFGDTQNLEIYDIHQGMLGDCYLMAALAALAQTNPDAIRNAIEDHGDGSYTVTFYPESGFKGIFGVRSEVKVTVTNEFPVLKGTTDLVYGRQGDVQELWPLIIEKAYAQYKGSYKNIEGGSAGEFIAIITGKDPTGSRVKNVDFAELKKQLDSGYAMTAGTYDKLNNAPTSVHKDHAYVIQQIDLNAQTITMYNPWGYDHPTVTFDEFKTHFESLTINEVK